MSKQQLDQFLERFAEDKELRADFCDDTLTAERVAAVAARHGYSFSAEELLTDVMPLTDKTWSNAAQLYDRDTPDTYILFLEEVPMSKEALNAFFKKVAEDEALQKKLIEFAAAQGFEFGADELNDSDLDSVAGGILTSREIKYTTLTDHKDELVVDTKIEGLTP